MPPEDDKSDDDKGGSDDSTTEVMQKAITNLADNQGNMSKGLKALSDNVISLTQRLDNSNDSNDDDDYNDTQDTDFPEDVESMSMKDVILFMEKRSEEREARLIKSFDGKVGAASSKADNVSLKAEVTASQTKHDDFDDWKEDIGLVARVSPSLSIEDMYTLAKAKNPEKVAKLEAEAEKKADKDGDDDDDKSGKSRHRYGGTESRKGGDESRKTNMKQREAGSAAYDEIFGT